MNVAKSQEAIPSESQKFDTDGEQIVAVVIRPPKNHGLETVSPRFIFGVYLTVGYTPGNVEHAAKMKIFFTILK